MMKTVEATMDTRGGIHLLEPLTVAKPCRVLVTLIEEPLAAETALLSQSALARDWESPEEEQAWEHLK